MFNLVFFYSLHSWLLQRIIKVKIQFVYIHTTPEVFQRINKMSARFYLLIQRNITRFYVTRRIFS